MNCYSQKIDKSQESKLKSLLQEQGAVFSSVQNALWRAKTTGFCATYYHTGKFLIQGAEVSDIADKVQQMLGVNTPQQSTKSQDNTLSDLNIPVCHIGSDESGKGDFFGPLVIAAVLTDEQSTKILTEAGIKDCKKVDDKNISKLAAVIKNNCVFSVITINPLKYNELYAKMNNLNRLLAWGHARAIENILEKKDCDYALSDKFGDEKLIQNALMQKGKKLHLEQRCKAEADIAVAAASIIAREQFLKGMKELSLRYGVNIHKGASSQVLETAKIIAQKFSKDELKNAAKIHFKTYSQI